MHLVIFVGTRPEIIRLSAIIKLAQQTFKTTVVHTGQNYDYCLNQAFFKDLQLNEPDYYLDCSKTNLGSTVGSVIEKSYNLLIELKPDAVLILGDTNSCLCAYSAKRLKIPIFHMEAGNRCFDPNVPEEINRKIIDHLSDINMCYMEQARQNLLKENIKPEYTFTIGSPLSEIYNSDIIKNNKSDILNKYNLEQNKYIVWSSHREENVDNIDNLKQMIECLKITSQKIDKVIFTVHPRTKKRLDTLNIKFNDNIIMCEPFGLIDYYELQKNSYCVISDSGTVTEESNIVGFKAILLRTSTEHPEGVDHGSIILCGLNPDRISVAIDMVNKLKIPSIMSQYNDINVSEKVCKIIVGYVDIVNKLIWRK